MINAEEVVAIRERLNLSRSVFATYLRTNLRTLENWEQGRAKPNAQAALLIHLVDRYPDTVKKIASV
jgi:putative transcriptional regulator